MRRATFSMLAKVAPFSQSREAKRATFVKFGRYVGRTHGMQCAHS